MPLGLPRLYFFFEVEKLCLYDALSSNTKYHQKAQSADTIIAAVGLKACI